MSTYLRSVRLAVVAALALTVMIAPGVAQGVETGTTQTFIVVAAQATATAGATARVESTGGNVLASYPAIGVVIASSERTDFATAVVGGGVQSAAATTGLATQFETDVETTVDAGTPDPATTSEPLWAQQWDMRAIQVAEAHSVTTGDSDVVVGVLDTGVDDSHPDLATQVDDSLSAGCVGGVA